MQSEIEKLAPCEATCWDQDVFTLSSFTLSKLLEVTRSFDFAILMATPDDAATRRGVSSPVPRDNVIFELALFFSALGTDRTFLIVDQTTADLRLP